MPAPTIERPKGYDYKNPRRINLVSVTIVLALVAGVYAAVKFGPVYFLQFKVDEVLEDARSRAEGASLARMSRQNQSRTAEEIIARTTERLVDLGLDPEQDQVEVYWDDDYSGLHAEYTFIVRHPTGHSTEMKFHRQIGIH